LTPLGIRLAVSFRDLLGLAKMHLATFLARNGNGQTRSTVFLAPSPAPINRRLRSPIKASSRRVLKNSAMSSSTTQRQTGSRGGVLIETALIGLVFFFLLIGAFDFGQFLFIHQALVERARSSVRWGAVTLAANESTSLDQIKNMILYNQSTNPGGTSGYFGLTSAMVDVTKTTDTVCAVSGSDPSLYVRFVVRI
jgi:hypothetical protein